MNADGARTASSSRGSNARWSPTGDRILYTAQGEPKGTQIFVRYMDAEGASVADHACRAVARRRQLVARRHAIAFTMPVVEEEHVADQDVRRAGGREMDRRRRESSSELDYRQDREGFNDDALSAPLRRSRDRRHSATADDRQLESHGRGVDARRPADPLHLASRGRCGASVARDGHLCGRTSPTARFAS